MQIHKEVADPNEHFSKLFQEGNKPTKGRLQDINHVVFLVSKIETAVEAWSKVFGIPKADISYHDGSPLPFDPVEYPCLYRGQDWRPDYNQTVYATNKMLFEVIEPGTWGGHREAFDKHGEGMSYFALTMGDKRQAYMNRINKRLGCETIVDQYWPGYGDWCILDTEEKLGIKLNLKTWVLTFTKPVIDDFAEITIVVPDIQKAVSGWTEFFDIKEPHIEEIRCSGLHHGKKEDMCFLSAAIDEGPWLFHLVQPGTDMEDTFAEYYRLHGNGAHHVSYRMDAEQSNKFYKHMTEELGYEVSAQYAYNGEKYTLYATSKDLGTDIAVVEKDGE